MTDPEELAFYRAIAAEPDDMTPRLVYADWLQERDQDDRAEFIRVGVQMEGLAPRPLVSAHNVSITAEPDTGESEILTSGLVERHYENIRSFTVDVDIRHFETQGVCYGLTVVQWSPSLPGGYVTVHTRDTKKGEPDPDTELYRELLLRSQELAKLPGVLSVIGDRWVVPVVWRGGFVHRIETSLSWWSEHGKRLLEFHPVREVNLTVACPQYHLDKVAADFPFVSFRVEAISSVGLGVTWFERRTMFRGPSRIRFAHK